MRTPFALKWFVVEEWWWVWRGWGPRSTFGGHWMGMEHSEGWAFAIQAHEGGSGWVILILSFGMFEKRQGDVDLGNACIEGCFKEQ